MNDLEYSKGIPKQKMSDPRTESERIEQNNQWFKFYVERLENHSVSELPKEGVKYVCPCCKFKTLDERGGFEICLVCYWEDDGQDDHDADDVRGGPNGSLSLSEARANFQKIGSCEERLLEHVRAPLPEEM